MIHTTRLTLRPLTAQDWPLFLALHDDPSVIALCFDKPSEDELKAKFVERLIPWDGTSRTPLCWCVENEVGQEIGVTGFTASASDKFEVGYLFLPQFHGKGYATEALNAVLEWAKGVHGITSFCAVVSEGNFGSMKVLENCGFRLEKTVPNAYQIGDQLLADYCYCLAE